MIGLRATRRLGVRLRVTLVALVATGIVLIGAAMLLVAVLRSTLVSEIDRSIDARAADIAAQVDGPNETIVLGAGIEDDTFAAVVTADGFFLDTTDESVDAAVVADLVDVFNDPFDVELPLQRTAGADNLRAVALFSDWEPLSTGDVAIVGDEDFIIVVATSLDPVDRTVETVGRGAMVAVPALTLVVAILVWALTGRALRPVEAIRGEVETISAGQLHRRVPVPESDDEIARLASTMNGMLDRLERSVEQQRSFVADASHELRSPLTSMRSRLDVSLRHGDADWPGTASAIHGETLRMQRLVEDLLLLARHDAEAGASATAHRPVDLDDVVFEVASEVGEVETATVSAGLAMGDREQLRRLVTNLVENAKRHATRRVAVSLVENESWVTLAVDDDGPGVAPRDRDRVFERFVRLDDARSRDSGGTGLGLAICHDIVTAHGGSIHIEDSPIGGARLIVHLARPTDPHQT